MTRPCSLRRSRCGLSILAACLAGLGGARAPDQPVATQPTSTPPAAVLDAASASPNGADRTEALPPELQGMNVVEKLNEKIPPGLEFVAHDGRKVRLGEYFDGQRPVILTLNYYRCPMLCGLILNGMLKGLKELDWSAGEQFRILTVSFDPLEGPDLAYLKRQNYLADYGRPAAAAGWDFLTSNSKKEPIDALLEATGFPVRWNERRREYIHPACLIVLTPDGRISRYLYGVFYEPGTLRLSLVEASEGKIGTTVDQILLFCFHYDAAEGRYALAAVNLMRAGGILTMVMLGSLLLFLSRRGRRHELASPTAAAGDQGVKPKS